MSSQTNKPDKGKNDSGAKVNKKSLNQKKIFSSTSKVGKPKTNRRGLVESETMKSTIKTPKTSKSAKKGVSSVKSNKKRYSANSPQAKGLKRFRDIQSILAEYCNENGIKFGREFQSKAAELYRRTKDTPLRAVRELMPVYMDKFLIPKADIVKSFDESFDFFRLVSVFSEPIFEGVMIRLVYPLDGDGVQFSHQGYSASIISWFQTEGLYRYLRENFNSSPVAQVILDGTDNTTYANYVISTGDITTKREAKKAVQESPLPNVGKPDDVKISESEKGIKPKHTDIEIDRLIALEKEKQATIKSDIEKMEVKLKVVKELKELGLSIDEIKKYLGM